MKQTTRSKLALQRTTLRTLDLSAARLAQVAGGTGPTWPTGGGWSLFCVSADRADHCTEPARQER